MASALAILMVNFSVPSGVNRALGWLATKRASFPGSIEAVGLNLMFTISRLRSIAVAPTRMDCSFSAA